jgi:flagellar basal-body rod protein FlgB
LCTTFGTELAFSGLPEDSAMDLFDASVTQIQQALNFRMLNQRLIAENVANVDTPGYQARRLDFEQSMARALQGIEQPAVVEQSSEPARTLDGNNVDMDKELSELGKNRLMYSVTSQLLAARFRQMDKILSSEPS